MTLRDRIGHIGSFLVSLVLRRPGDILASRLFSPALRPGYVQQSGMLILTDINPANQSALLATLDDIRVRLIDAQKCGGKISFQKTKTVHYAGWMILPGVKNLTKRSGSAKTASQTSSDGNLANHIGDPVADRRQELQDLCTGPAKLAFETNYDGSLEAHLHDLVINCRDELDSVYKFSPDYPAPKSKEECVEAFLYDRWQKTNSSIDTSAYYVALPGRSLEDIRNAIAVYNEAKSFINNLSNKSNDPKKIRCALVEHFRNNAMEEPRRFPITQKGLRRLFTTNMAVLTVLSLAPPIAFFLHWFRWLEGLKGLFAITMVVLTLLCLMPLLYFIRWAIIDLVARYFEAKERCKERKQKTFDPTGHCPRYDHLDLGQQNHLCTYTTVRAGWFRMYVLRRALWLGPILFRYFFILGKLDQITTVHFARWTLIGQQLIFYSNYDGSWSSYLNDFSDEAWGVNLVWGNTIGFPQTKFIVGAGARDLEGFEAQAAEHYAPAPVFYSAYRNHSLANLLRYLEFRDELLEEIGG